MKNYITITKPGIILGNLVTVSGGFFLASHYKPVFSLFIYTLLGISLIIACGCVLNNIIDRDIDALMKRTQNRVMVKGLIQPIYAFIYGVILFILGSLLLYLKANLLTMLIAYLGLFFYVAVYTLGAKRNTVYGTLIGSISGAIPPIVGYVSVSNSIDLGSIILFFILASWQMPHFYAIAIFRESDYQNAKIPVLPLKQGIRTAKWHMLVFILLFMLLCNLLTIFKYTNLWFLIIISILNLSWLLLAILGFKTLNDKAWARKMFGVSILIITLLSILMALMTNRLLA